jgi:hypothetical protein
MEPKLKEGMGHNKHSKGVDKSEGDETRSRNLKQRCNEVV